MFEFNEFISNEMEYYLMGFWGKKVMKRYIKLLFLCINRVK